MNATRAWAEAVDCAGSTVGCLLGGILAIIMAVPQAILAAWLFGKWAWLWLRQPQDRH